MLQKLEEMNIFMKSEGDKKSKKETPDEYRIKESKDQIKETLGINNIKLLDTSSKILNEILFESKEKLWWIYVSTLSNYIDWLYTHSINVALISVMLGKALHMEDGLQDLAIGSFFHDIGKLMIPKNIIQKKGSLTEEEMFYIRQHCDLGISMVSDFRFSRRSKDIIHQHHERLDGSGYPLGLKSEQIPLHTRIVMIADILDAITAYRPYKEPEQIEIALQELQGEPQKYPQEIINTFKEFL